MRTFSKEGGKEGRSRQESVRRRGSLGLVGGGGWQRHTQMHPHPLHCCFFHRESQGQRRAEAQLEARKRSCLQGALHTDGTVGPWAGERGRQDPLGPQVLSFGNPSCTFPAALVCLKGALRQAESARQAEGSFGHDPEESRS